MPQGVELGAANGIGAANIMQRKHTLAVDLARVQRRVDDAQDCGQHEVAVSTTTASDDTVSDDSAQGELCQVV